MQGQMSFIDVLKPDTLTVEPMDYEDTKPFLLGVHYARRMPCIQYAFGLHFGGVLSDA